MLGSCAPWNVVWHHRVGRTRGSGGSRESLGSLFSVSVECPDSATALDKQKGSLGGHPGGGADRGAASLGQVRDVKAATRSSVADDNESRLAFVLFLLLARPLNADLCDHENLHETGNQSSKLCPREGSHDGNVHRNGQDRRPQAELGGSDRRRATRIGQRRWSLFTNHGGYIHKV